MLRWRTSQPRFATLNCRHFAYPATQQLSSNTEDTKYCVALTQRADYENFLAALLLPWTARRSVFAIRSFNAELAQIPDSTNNTLIAQMRYQFWTETLENVFADKPPDQPIARELHRAVLSHKLSKRWLSGLIQARRTMAENAGLKTVSQLEEYCSRTAVAVLYLTLEALGIRNVHADHVASHVGKAQGIVNQLRAVPFHANKGKVFLPEDLLLLHNASKEDILRCKKDQQSLRDLAFDLAAQANLHLIQARELKSSLPAQAYLAFVGAASCDCYLTALRRSSFDVFAANLQQRNGLLPWTLLARKLLRQY